MRERLYVVVPCYNEEAVLSETAGRLKAKLGQMAEAGQIDSSSRVLFVNDGSKDRTWELIEEIHGADPLFSGISLAHNRGHQNALLAGLLTAKEYADVVISMDADLQDDIDVMDEMLRKYREGYDVVYGVRSSRRTDTFFKRFSAESFYRLAGFMGMEIIFNHADYRLTSRRVLKALEGYQETNLFLRGVFPDIGFPAATVEYERGARPAGESKYSRKRMIAFALDGITSFTVWPLRLISGLGTLASGAGALCLAIGGVRMLLGHPAAWRAALIGSVWLVGGLQLLCLGIVGEYVGKTYFEAKRRPRFILEKSLLEEETASEAVKSEP